MGFSEEISEDLDSTEAKKNGLKNSIFAALSSYRDFEKYAESTNKKFREWYLALESREKNLDSVEESLRQNSEELKLIREHIDERLRQIEDEENRLVGLAVKEKEWEVSKERLVEELREKERELNEKEVLINGVSERLELEKNELVSMENLVVKRLNELDDRERKVKESEKMVGSNKGLEDSLRVDRERVIEMKENEERLIRQDLELKEEEIDKLIALHGQRVKNLDMRENQLEEKTKELEEVAQERLKECQLKEMQWQVKTELWEKRNQEIEQKMKQYEEKIKVFEMREKVFEVEKKKLIEELSAREPVKKVAADDCLNNGSSPNFKLSVELDGLNVDMSLNGLKIDLTSKNEVLKALQESGSPAYMVLKVIESLYPPYLMKVDTKFQGIVANSCIVLLEQLIVLSPKIQSRERDHALRLACEWKAMMVSGKSLEVLGFLYLLASFQLASAFATEEVLKLVETAAEHPQIPELCMHLGLRDKIPGIIQNLLKITNNSLQAIELIHAFELADQFPPVPILKQYLKQFKRPGKVTHKIPGQQTDAIDQRIVAIKAVHRCVVDHKLESQISPKDLEHTIEQLLQLKQGKCSEFSVNHKAQHQKEVEGRKSQISSGSDVNLAAEVEQKVEANFPNCLMNCDIDPELSNTDPGPPHAMALLLANMNGKILLSFLDIHLADHQLLQAEVFTALQISQNSSKLVLDVVEGFCSSYPCEQGSRSCIFLLEQLMRLAPLIPVDVRDMAHKIALDWKAKIAAEFGSPLVVVVFLLFISGFRLISAFDDGELLQLYKIVLEDTSILGLCQSLSISKMIPGIPHIRADDLQLDINSVTSAVSLEQGVQSLSSHVQVKSGVHGLCCTQIPRFIQYSSEPAELVLDALDFSYFSDSPKKRFSELIAKSFFYLLKQLMSVSPVIKPWVHRRAFKVANGWKQNLTGSNVWEVLAFLQLVGVYGLSSSFTAAYLLGLLEGPSQLLKEASNITRILGLEHEVPGFVTMLIAKKQYLLAFEYVFEFNLVDKIPPVALLKKHVLQVKLLAMEMCKDTKATHEEQGQAIFNEISALEDVIKCILERDLQTEYSPHELRQRVAQLETQRVNLRASRTATASRNSRNLDDNSQRRWRAQGKAPSEQENTRKRPALHHRGITKGAAQLPPSKKFRQFNSPAKASLQSIQCPPILSGRATRGLCSF